MTSLAELLGKDARERIVQVKQGLRSLAAMLSRRPGGNGPDARFELKSAPTSEPAACRAAVEGRREENGEGAARKRSRQIGM